MAVSTAFIERLVAEFNRVITPAYLARAVTENAQAARSEVAFAVRRIMTRPPFLVEDAAEQSAAVEAVIAQVMGFGPIDALLNDPSVTEVMVNGSQTIFFERAGVLHRHPSTFASDEEVRVLIDRIISPLGRRIDERTPLVDARLPEGHRVHAVIPPLALDGPVLTIRKFRAENYDLDELAAMGSLPDALVALLHSMVRARFNLAVTGGTGSGKTTLLNALSNEIDARERIITIEDSAELRFHHHPHVVRLESRAPNLEGEGAVTIRDLVITSLRMRPDRIVVGEVRGAEALEMLQAMNTGHDGSLTTFHANSPDEAAGRLMTMVGYGAQLPTTQVLAQIASAFDAIVHQTRFSDGTRRVTRVALVCGHDASGLRLQTIYTFETTGVSEQGNAEGRGVFSVPPALLERLVRTGALSREGADRWVHSLQSSEVRRP